MSIRTFSLREHVKMVALLITPTLFLFSCKVNDQPPKQHDNKIITVDNRSENSGKANFSDLDAAISSAPEQSRIICSAGTYIVDNPIQMSRKGVRLTGAGKGDTIIVPRNVGKPIISLQADDLGVEHIGMTAEVLDKSGRATFAILIEEGYGNCQIHNTKIQDMGGSSIIGQSVDGCLIDHNIIISSGDDAIKVRGTRISISNNILIRYFDEGIDVAGGENITIRNNISSSGRIGIVVDDSINALIFGNIVENHQQEGIVLRSVKGGIVENNLVIDSRGIAFHLHSPANVKSNVVAGENDVGFRIREMRGGIVEGNIILGKAFGIDFSESSRNLVRMNRYIGKREFRSPEEDGHNEFYGNIAGDGYDNGKKSKHMEKMVSGKIIAENQKSFSEYKKLQREASEKYDEIHVVVSGRSEEDLEYAEKETEFLREKNPGYLSLQVNGDIMTSKITDDLYLTLKGGGQPAIGLVRVPFLRFRNKSDSHFPIWHLFLNDEKVAVVSYMPYGANVKISFLDDGNLGLIDQLEVWKNHFLTILHAVKLSV